MPTAFFEQLLHPERRAAALASSPAGSYARRMSQTSRALTDEASANLELRVPRYLDEADLRSPQRRVVTPLVLFLATCFTTYATGAYNWKNLGFLTFDQAMFRQLIDGWQTGLTYMLAVMGILLAHEMGHFLMTVRHAIRSSYPLFIPLPLTFTGTMGAVIVMEGSRANRRQLFDIGIAGPLAGLVLAIPLICLGIRQADTVKVEPLKPNQFAVEFGDPLLVKLLTPVLRPDVGEDRRLEPNALYMAGWVGLLITGLNMLPISQLDGGHVAYAVFGRNSRWIARALLMSAMAFIIVGEQYTWTLMVVVVTLLGIHHPPSANDLVPMGWGRRVLGTLSLAIPIFCFTPYPLSILTEGH